MASTIDEARTPAELAEWLRLWAKAYEEGVDYLDDNDARQIADAVERVCAPCNAAALREALANVERVAKYCAEMPWHTPGYPTDAARADALYSRIAELGRVARAALAAPARNCDVGTAEEQKERFKAFCEERDCHKCPFYGKSHCPLQWALAPFAPAEGGAE